MRRTRFDQDACPIARTADLIGDWWTPVVMREAFYGSRRFEQFQERLGVSRATLTERLNRLVEEGMLEKVPYQSNPVRNEYRLTEKGRDFYSVLAAMFRWGDRWLFGEKGASIELADKATGMTVRPEVVDASTGEAIDVRRIVVRSRRRTKPATS
jgi:DNA-binding HxlR family transcriptional regulator